MRDLCVRFVRAAAIVAGLVLALVAGWGGSPAQAQSRQETLVIARNIDDYITNDVHRTYEYTSQILDHVAYDTLVTVEAPDFTKILPNLATKWEVSKDGLTYTFTLRSGAKFTSGNPVTADDVRFSLRRLKYLKDNPSFFMDPVKDIEAVKPTTVKITLKAPDASFLAALAAVPCGIADAKTLIAKGATDAEDAKEKDKAEAYLNSHSAGTGAFVLESYVPQQEIVLVKNPNYWRGPVALDRVVVRNVIEPSAQALMVQKGDMDIAVNIQADQARQLRNVQGVVVKSSPELNVVNIIINTNPEISGQFANPKVREAIRYAIDYQGVMALTAPGTRRSAGIIPPSFPGARPTSEAVKTDKQRARALLQQANLTNLEGTFFYSSTYAGFGLDLAVLAQKIQQDLAAIGIKLKIVDEPYVTEVTQYRQGKLPMGIGGWLADYMDQSDYLVFLPGRTVGKRLQWFVDSSPEAREIAKLGEQTETEVDPAKVIGLYQQLDRRLSEQGPYIPLYQPAVSIAYRSNLKGVTYTTGWYVDYSTISKT